MKKIIILASLSSFIKHFETNNIKILKELGYQVFIAGNTESRNEFLEIEGINVYDIPLTRFPLSKGNLVGFYKLIKFIKDNKIDCIDCHTPTGGLLGRIIARICGIKVIYTAHGFHFFKGAPIFNWVVYYPVEYILSFFTDILITINNEDFRLSQKYFKAKKILKIPGVGFETKKFRDFKCNREIERKKLDIKKNDIVLLSIGELSSRKNHEIVIKALDELKIKNLKYLIIGEGQDKNKYKNLIKKYFLEKQIFLLGKKNNVELYCGISDIFIHPSIREGLGIAALEGMASGLPLIASDINGIKDYSIDGKTGISIEPLKIESVKNAIIKLMNDKDLRVKYGDYNREKAKEYDQEKTNAILKENYQKLLIEKVI